MTVFRILPGNFLDEGSVMELVRLNAIMTSKVDSFNITDADACKKDDETEVTKTATEQKRKKCEKTYGSDGNC